MVSITISVPGDYPTTSMVAVHEAGQLPEYGQVWVWDMYFAQVLFELGECPEADELKEILDIWAVNMSSKIHQPFEHIKNKGHTRIHSDLDIAEAVEDAGYIELTIHGDAREMPRVTVSYGQSVTPSAKCAAVIALAQYFVDKNELFAKELPIHVLAFRKYYSDIKPHTAHESVEEAPLFAIQKALEYYNSVAQGTMQ